MKYILILLVCLPLLSEAQKRDTIPKYNRSPGDELRLASKRGGLGVLMVFGGSAAIVLSQGTSEVNTALGVLGGVIGVFGFVFMINGWSHINKAGQKMNERKIGMTFKDGIGVRYRI